MTNKEKKTFISLKNLKQETKSKKFKLSTKPEAESSEKVKERNKESLLNCFSYVTKIGH